jgi:hypothetical protein
MKRWTGGTGKRRPKKVPAIIEDDGGIIFPKLMS